MSLLFNHHKIGPHLCMTAAYNHSGSETAAAAVESGGQLQGLLCVLYVLMYSISR